MRLTHIIFSWLSFWVVVSANYLAAETQGITAHGLRSGWFKSDGQYMAALEIRLAPGWKTYWRAPGETGFPPQFDFSGSHNLQEVEIVWPAPMLFGPKDMWSIGYSDHVVLPLLVQPSDPQSLVSLNLQASLGICDDICIPMALSFSGFLKLVIRNDENQRNRLSLLPNENPQILVSHEIAFSRSYCNYI